MKAARNILLPVLAWIGGLSILSAFAIFLIVEQSRAALAVTKADLEKRGESFDIRQLAPPAAPSTGNGAQTLVAAGEALRAAVKQNSLRLYPAGQSETSPGKAEVLHHRPSLRRLKQDIPWEEFQRDMKPLQPLLAEIRTSAEAPLIEVSLDYSKGVSMSLPHLTPFLTSGQYLSAECILALRNNDSATATKNIETILRIAGVASQQPTLINRLVAASVVGLGQAATWEFLQATPSSAELLRVQRAWEHFSLLDAIPALIRMERACTTQAFAYDPQTLGGLSTFSTAGGTAWDRLAEPLEWVAWSVLFRHSDERHFILYYQDLLDQIAGGNSWASVMARARAGERDAVEGIGRKMSAAALPVNNGALAKIISHAALQSLTITAIALRRFQNDHGGELPQKIEDLVPGYLSALPIDPMTGAPVQYRREDAEFQLYAVGQNGVDDGGTATPPPGKTRRGLVEGIDIVWPRVTR